MVNMDRKQHLAMVTALSSGSECSVQVQHSLWCAHVFQQVARDSLSLAS